MTIDADILAVHRAELTLELRRVLARVRFSHAALLGQQLERAVEAEAAGSGWALVPGAACLYVAEALGGRRESALGPAASLSWLALLAEVFAEIRDETPEGSVATLLRTWGMPRTLNAGDALFAFAQESALDGQSDDGPASLRTLAGLDAASRDLSEALLDPTRASEGATGRAGPIASSLLAAAYTFAAVASGMGAAEVDALAEIGRSLAGASGPSKGSVAVSEETRLRLAQLADYLKRKMQQ